MKVAQQDVAREVAVPQPGKIVQRLRLGLFEVSASALLLNEKDALPEKVNETTLVAKVLDRLLEARDAAHRDAENIEEIAIEKLRLPLLVSFPRPVLGESGCSQSDFIPG